jgi:hypothetical protein
MKHKLLCTLGLIVLGLVAFAASPAKAQTIAPGPYYATPSWDQTLPCTTTATCPRFIVLSNMSSAAVLDRETRLVWEQSPDGVNRRTWLNAQIHCNQKPVGNRRGWRLPTLQELASLMDPSSVAFPGPTLPAGHPFSNMQSSSFYWSATTNANVTSDAWAVLFGFGGGVTTAAKSNVFFVWCVRGGQGVDPQ